MTSFVNSPWYVCISYPKRHVAVLVEKYGPPLLPFILMCHRCTGLPSYKTHITQVASSLSTSSFCSVQFEYFEEKVFFWQILWSFNLLSVNRPISLAYSKPDLFHNNQLSHYLNKMKIFSRHIFHCIFLTFNQYKIAATEVFSFNLCIVIYYRKAANSWGQRVKVQPNITQEASSSCSIIHINFHKKGEWELESKSEDNS